MVKSLAPASLQPTIIQLNIRELNPKSNQRKRQYLNDIAIHHNNFIKVCTETHLNTNIDDTEANMKDWNLFRSDQTSRSHGGVYLYEHDQYLLTHEFGYSNFFCEGLCIFLLYSNLALCCLYRPPVCPLQLFEDIISQCDNWKQK